LLVDPEVTRAKFEREVTSFRAIEADYRRRGCFMVRVEFPEILVIFATPQVRPAMLVFAAKFDFSNYDLWPPSVQLVDPLTWVPYRKREAPTRLLQLVRVGTDAANQPVYQ